MKEPKSDEANEIDNTVWEIVDYSKIKKERDEKEKRNDETANIN
ncbi:MAG: hypothetical protein K1000chlam1_01210 [Candidatus Anoxychlamydiales bacterium]|nr:hypothetical protein [Candidatus Anoxychlamydiales bacterium]